MAFTYDPSTDIGKMRLIIPDKDEEEAFFSDAELQAFMSAEGDWRRGSALAIETLATDDLLVLKMFRIQNVEVNGVDRAASALLRRATTLRQQALDAESNAGDSFDVFEVVWDDFTYRQKVRNLAFEEG